MVSLPCAVHFGAVGDYRLYAREDWHHDPNERQHTWCAHVAKMSLPIEPPAEDLTLAVDIIPLQARGVEQQLFVFVNGSFVAFFPIPEPCTVAARIPANILSGGECMITFVAPNAVSPMVLGSSQDSRVLSFAFRSLSLAATRGV